MRIAASGAVTGTPIDTLTEAEAELEKVARGEIDADEFERRLTLLHAPQAA